MTDQPANGPLHVAADEFSEATLLTLTPEDTGAPLFCFALSFNSQYTQALALLGVLFCSVLQQSTHVGLSTA